MSHSDAGSLRNRRTTRRSIFRTGTLALGWFLFVHSCACGALCSVDTIWDMTSDGTFQTEEDCNLTGSQIFDEMERSGRLASQHVFALAYQCVEADDARLRVISTARLE
jgi:hypothetical protein